MLSSNPASYQKYHTTHENALELKGYLDGYADYERFAIQTKDAIFLHPKLFNAVLKKSATDYLNKTRHDWFRSAGKTRGENLQTSAHEAKDIVDSIQVLKEAIKEGANKPDSLKTFLYKLIQANFCDQEDVIRFRGYPMRIGADQFLSDIVKHAEADPRFQHISSRQAKEIHATTGLPENLTNLMKGY